MYTQTRQSMYTVTHFYIYNSMFVNVLPTSCLDYLQAIHTLAVVKWNMLEAFYFFGSFRTALYGWGVQKRGFQGRSQT